jgi:hypothetical protein
LILSAPAGLGTVEAPAALFGGVYSNHLALLATNEHPRASFAETIN